MDALALLNHVFDVVLSLGLVGLAWQALGCTDLFKAVVLFVAFGLLMALAWVRLNSPDIALAEAAIGAGMTGALLLAALAKLRSAQAPDSDAQIDTALSESGPSTWARAALVSVAAAGLGLAIWSLTPYQPELGKEVSAHLGASGVNHPVTAVLVNFRAYDTMLEMFVLLLAAVGIWSLGAISTTGDSAPGPILENLSRLLLPVFVLVVAHLIWVGAHAPGGAFQAGAVLGAAGVLMVLAGWRLRDAATGLPTRLILVAGAGVFLLVAILTSLIRGQLLEYPPEQAGMVILALEIAASASIGGTLVALFLGGRPARGVNQA